MSSIPTQFTKSCRYGISDLDLENDMKGFQLLDHEIVWTLSSVKYGYGVEKMLNYDPLLFWQSDGLRPHFIKMVFPSLTAISAIAFRIMPSLDRNFAPLHTQWLSCTTENDWRIIWEGNLVPVDGWVILQSDNILGKSVENCLSNNDLLNDKKELKPPERPPNDNRLHSASSEVTKKRLLNTVKDIFLLFHSHEEKTILSREMKCIFHTNQFHGRNSRLRGIHVYGSPYSNTPLFR